MQRRIGRKKSIFEKIKALKYPDSKSGMKEINYIYGREAITSNEQVISANRLCAEFARKFQEKSYGFSFDFCERPLIAFFKVFMDKINILVKEEEIDKSWIKALTKEYVFKSNSKDEVKLGLILAEKYLEEDELITAVEVFTRSGEFIYYLTKAIKNMPKCNSYMFKLLKETKGTLKIFALTNIEILSEEINTYIFEEGYKNKIYEEILVEYVLISGNIKAYLTEIEDNKNKINKFSYLIYKHLNNYKLKDSEIKYELIYQYLPLALKGSSFLALVCITSIWRQLVDLKDIDEVREELYKEINNINKKKWTKIFFKELQRSNYKLKDMITIAEYYGLSLSFQDLKIFFEKKPMELDGYLYLTLMGSKRDKLEVFNFFQERVQMAGLLNGPENINTNNLNGSDSEYIILSLLINGLRDIYPEGKDLAIKCLNGGVNDIRGEAIKTLKKYKKQLTTEEKEIIKRAADNEPNFEVRKKFKMLCEELEEGKIEYINTKGMQVTRHIKDVYLLTSSVARSRYRNREYVQREIKLSKVFNLVLEADNTFDKNSIKIAGESGFVIGYIPRKDNFILSNLLRGGRYLYCVVKEYNLDENYIIINIYLSYKNIVKEAETLIQMMTSDGGDFEN
ncbi:MAG: HIRAN domain-containing protein [Clostridium sp.]|nr:HIRAN domain-containing protein [Clostridium sp.]MDU7082632.1 HIRAN domain-containing protein [Clostridium sp.]